MLSTLFCLCLKFYLTARGESPEFPNLPAQSPTQLGSYLVTYTVDSICLHLSIYQLPQINNLENTTREERISEIKRNAKERHKEHPSKTSQEFLSNMFYPCLKSYLLAEKERVFQPLCILQINWLCRVRLHKLAFF